MVSTMPSSSSQGASVRVYYEDRTVQQGVFVWLTADGRNEVCIVCGSHMRLPFIPCLPQNRRRMPQRNQNTVTALEDTSQGRHEDQGGTGRQEAWQPRWGQDHIKVQRAVRFPRERARYMVQRSEDVIKVSPFI